MSFDLDWIKHFHMLCATLTFGLFVGRGALMFRDVPLRGRRWARVLPDSVDTLLLASGVLLAVNLYQYPLVHPWLTVKVAAIVLYIALGFVAFRFGRTKRVRMSAWLAALGVFGYIVLVAYTRQPLPGW
ncbi:MAG TPA: SirB2 family protein [Mariprofundaceae bacterium]|nr:SirB2 family protein [Mariprofundaceae bacterium]